MRLNTVKVLNGIETYAYRKLTIVRTILDENIESVPKELKLL